MGQKLNFITKIKFLREIIFNFFFDLEQTVGLIPIMETFECDPQRLAKLDRRFGSGEAPPPPSTTTASLHHPETSESDNSHGVAN